MKTLRSIPFLLFVLTIAALAADAQTPAPTAAPGRVYVINPNMFADEKAGITKYVAAATKLVGEFAKDQSDLQAISDKVQKLAGELKVLQQQINDGKVPVDQATAKSKNDEYERLQREFQFKQDDAKARYDKREAELLGPIRADIGKSIAEYGKKNGYWMILDASKLDEAGAFLSIDAGADITKAFIVYYNARP